MILKRIPLWLALGLGALYLSACATTSPPVASPAVKLPVDAAKSFAKNVRPESQKAEAALLKKYPDLARRDDNTLTLFSHGKPFATRVSNPADCEGFDTCKLWLFDGLITLLDPKTGRTERYIQLIYEHGEGGGESVVQTDGKDFWLNTRGLPSPDGKWIAAGSSSVDEMNDSHRLSLFDWTGKAPAVTFAPSCKPLAWQDSSHFTAKCTMGAADTDSIEGMVSRDAKGQWQIVVTQSTTPSLKGKVFVAAPLSGN